MFKGKSVNTPSFLLAALKHLKLVRPMRNKQRHHEPLNPQPFLDDVKKLMAAETKPKTASKTVRKKAAVKKKAVSRKPSAKPV